MGSEEEKQPFDVLDLLINLLKEHEKKLDEVAYRIERVLEEKPAVTKEPRATTARGVSVLLKRWSDFKRRGTGADMVAFSIDKEYFKVSGLVGGIVFVYKEKIPGIEFKLEPIKDGKKVTGVEIKERELLLPALRGKLDCGLELTERDVMMELTDGSTTHKYYFEIDPFNARRWLADQLKIDVSMVIEGELTFSK